MVVITGRAQIARQLTFKRCGGSRGLELAAAGRLARARRLKAASTRAANSESRTMDSCRRAGDRHAAQLEPTHDQTPSIALDRALRATGPACTCTPARAIAATVRRTRQVHHAPCSPGDQPTCTSTPRSRRPWRALHGLCGMPLTLVSNHAVLRRVDGSHQGAQERRARGAQTPLRNATRCVPTKTSAGK
jgi:NAD(P)-dependent dehydrogenase (short-subunit alcohol dehydrogenase family)